MKTVIRADASSRIGGGHIMRCLTLADELARRGGWCVFAVRPGSVETVPKLAQSGHEVVELAGPQGDEAGEIEALLGKCDWLIVDHYGLDAQFERAARGFASKIMVIDDLADRPHDCDLLLDQTYGREKEDYAGLVPEQARLLMGTDYALLRPEFAALRPAALELRKQGGPVRCILVSFGASDPHGTTAKALQAIKQTSLDVHIDVVTGSGDPAAMGLVEITKSMSQQVNFHGFDADMAKLMLNADLAIGAGGSTSWERCCMGLPTLTVVVAENQIEASQSLARVNATKVIEGNADIGTNFIEFIAQIERNRDMRFELSFNAFAITDGRGLDLVLQACSINKIG